MAELTEDIQCITVQARRLRECLGDGPEQRNGSGPAAEVVTHWIEAGLSDPHHRGRTVVRVSLANGLHLIYKPRDVTAEAALHHLLTWCNTSGAPLDLVAPRVLCRSGYGWVECVQPQPLSNASDAARYYRRAGALLALLHLLGGIDAHCENIMAAGEYPVLVDAETLLTPELAHVGMAIASPAAARLACSVLRTGMLPGHIGDARWGLGYDVSALGEPSGVCPKIPQWRDVNTDAMRLVFEPGTLPTDHLPKLNDQPVCARAHRDEVSAGFRAMSHWLIAQQPVLLATHGPLAAFREVVTRFIFRPTAVYGMVLHASLRPERLRSGIDRSLELEVLTQLFADASTRPAAWTLLAAEREALEDLDVPYFAVRATSTALELGPEQPALDDFFQRSGFDALIERVRQFDMQTLDTEIALIEGAFTTATPRAVAAVAPVMPVVAPLSTSTLLSAAEAMARTLADRAVYGQDGTADWYGRVPVDEAGHCVLQPVGPSLYNGTVGITLFLAALDRVRGTSEYRSLVLAAAETTVRMAEAEQTLPIGGATGLGSIVYGLVRLAGFTQTPALLTMAQRVAARLTPARIAADRELDVISGAAGTVLGLLTLHQATGEVEVLRAAVAAGQHLVRSATETAAGPKAWCSHAPQPLTGMSHGAAGIAYALLRLYGATGKICCRDAAVEGMAYEASVFAPQDGNWPDLRAPDATASQVSHTSHRSSWCHGAPGIGLARLGGLPYLDSPDVRRDIETALTLTRSTCFGPIDHLCCGVFGRLETLLVAASVLDREGLHIEALGHTAHALTRGICVDHTALALAPGFFRGIAGIGYQFLRLALPNALPSILLWE
jgi:type 2 lantibiotic biosynthesis protein LanM